MRLHRLLCLLGFHAWYLTCDKCRQMRKCPVCLNIEHQIDVPGMPWVAGRCFCGEAGR